MSDTFKVTQTKFLLSANKMKRAIKFYQDVMGLEIKCQSTHWSELKFGDAIVTLHGGGSGKFHATGLSFTVTDIHQAVDRVSKNGGTVRSKPEDRGTEGIILASVTDTEGNGFMISQNK